MKSALALTALMTAATASYAAPPDVAVNEDMEYNVYFLGTAKGPNNTVNVHRGFYDEAAGVTCEWTATGQILDKSKMRVTAKFDSFACAQHNVPAAWIGGNVAEPSTRYDRNVTYNPVKRMVIEVSTKPANEINVTSAYRREWDFAKDRVCLSQTEGQIQPNGSVNVYMDQKMGCFDIKNNFHAWLLEKNLDLQ